METDGAPPRPVELPRPIKAEEFAARHLLGTTRLGVYLLDGEQTYCSCLDFDDHGGTGEEAIANARTVLAFLTDSSIPALLEISQSGTGAHVWVIHSHSIQAKVVRQFWSGVLRLTETTAEVYPKQSSTVGLDKGLGNFVRYPLSGKSHFENLQGETLDPIDVLTHIEEVSPYLIQTKADAWGESQDDHSLTSIRSFDTDGLPERVVALLQRDPNSNLSRRWSQDSVGMQDQSRSALVQAIATELVRAYVPTPEIEAALTWWCEQQDYKRDSEWLRLTVVKSYGFVQELKQKESIRVGTFCGMAHNALDALENPVLIASGIEALDASIQGIGLGELAVLAARPGCGKSALAIEWMDSAAACGFPGMIFSMEMGSRPIFQRVLTRLGFNADQPYDKAEAHKAIDRYYQSRAPMYFIENTVEVDEVCDSVRDYVRQHGIKFVVIDHLGCMQTRTQNEYERLTECVEAMAELKKTLDVGILLLCHLGRDYERDGSKRPQMRHLRGSGAIENCADLVLGARWSKIERPNEPELFEHYTMHVLKCRNRETKAADVSCRFLSDRQKFL